MTSLRPFFSYFGGKWRIAPRYPAPEHDTVVEPFAGSAGYSLRHAHKRVILVEKYEPVAAVWEYLIHATQDEILTLGDVPDGGTVDEIDGPQEARWLAGFWISQAATTPGRSATAWVRSHAARGSATGWTAKRRLRIARQLPAIRHWQVVHGDYRDAPDVEATWFVDPPYAVRGKHYPEHDLDYAELAEWCRARRGLAIVCEGEAADWLPFRHFCDAKKASNIWHDNVTSPERIWINRT